MMRVALYEASLVRSAVTFALASALVACAASARGVQTEARGEFQSAAGTPAEAPAAFEFESGGFSYRVAANGNGQRVKGDHKTRRYNLHLNSGEAIRRLYFTLYGDDLLLLCDVDGGEAGPSVFITLLEQPSMRARWRQSAPTDGVEVLRHGGTLYLGGAGFVARLELNGGAYAWQHRDRREEGGDREDADRDGVDGEKDDRESVKRREAEALIPPGRYVPAEVSGDTVVFRAARASAEQGAKTVRVNRKTGKVVSVE